jgi:hypothetical protein
MVSKRIIGYVLIAVGLIAIALTFQQVLDLINITLPDIFSNFVLTIGGVVLIVVGAMFFRNNRNMGKGVEVPIYKGKEVVGYRRQ